MEIDLSKHQARIELGTVTDLEIEKVWQFANFGEKRLPEKEWPRIRRDIVEQGLLEIQASYTTGYTLKCILIELGLMTEKYHVTKKGHRFLYKSFKKNQC